ncbi:hypothetical protein BDN70DRAFT_935328 [Pholiota conissans]|uniref:DUF6532 domain-containing protein n=1 Tax=Pholiota conissans TaxID=109636 RepID=A0A9P6CXA4_9AGAR|nr:hypothetical protein BDN70DRAFT_935328 [Pholiota conissans]
MSNTSGSTISGSSRSASPISLAEINQASIEDIQSSEEAVDLLQEAFEHENHCLHLSDLAIERVYQALVEEERAHTRLIEAKNRLKRIVGRIRNSGYELFPDGPGFFLLIKDATRTVIAAGDSAEIKPPVGSIPMHLQRLEARPLCFSVSFISDTPPNGYSVPGVRFEAGVTEGNKENDALGQDSQPRNARGGPVRANRGQGGHLHQLQKAFSQIRPDLNSDSTRRQGSNPRHAQGNFPPSLPENEMAPLNQGKQKKKAGTTAVQYKRPINPDPPLQPAPKPRLFIAPPISRIDASVHQQKGYGTGRNIQQTIQSHQEGVQSRSTRESETIQSQREGVRSWSTTRESEQILPLRVIPTGASAYETGFQSRQAQNDAGPMEEDGDSEDGGLEYVEHNLDIDPTASYFKDGRMVPIHNNRDDGYGYEGESNQREPEGNDGLEPGFDISPSEDDEAAMRALHGGEDEQQPEPCINSDTCENIPDNLSLDVLQVHRERNRANKAPDPRRLAEFAGTQYRVNSRAEKQLVAEQYNPENQTDDSAGAASQNDDDDDDEEELKKRAKRNSRPGSKILKPTTLQFYRDHHGWPAVLTQAKRRWRRHVVLVEENPFTNSETDTHLVTALIDNVIQETLDRGGLLDESCSHDSHMDTLVFQEGTTFRGVVKAEAIRVVEEAYKDAISPEFEGGQVEYQALVRANINNLLDTSAFHQNGLDEIGKTNNFAHPAISTLIRRVFYRGPESLAALYPEDFRKKVPVKIIALAMTAIRNALQEWLPHGGLKREKISFSGQSYSTVFESMMKAIDKLRPSPYHLGKFEKNRELWAEAGM